MKTNTSSALLAFHGLAVIKKKYLSRVRAHAKADEIINGLYWQNGKGCAVGCTVHSDNHGAYEIELGIPRILARLEDRLFEALFTTDPVLAKAWPARFLSAIKPGANLSLVWPKFALWLLMDETHGVVRFAKREATKQAISSVWALYQRWSDGDKPSTTEWESARRAAYAAAAAYADDAAVATLFRAVRDTAAADAADAAADAAAYAAYAAYADGAAAAYARRKHYVAMADKLIDLLQAAPKA